MGINAKREYLQSIYHRYRNASKSDKKVILKEFCTTCGYHRKYAIRLLNQEVSHPPHRSSAKRGPKKKYDHPDILKILNHLWKITNLPCSKRLKVIIPLWLPYYPFYILDPIKKALLTISPATIDRLLKPMRARFQKVGLSTTKPGSLLHHHIPIKTGQWDESVPGYLEADAVAHCGTSVAGMFVYTINCVDIATGWSAQRAVWGKGEAGVMAAIQCMEKNLPFTIRGFDCDNGSEFINWHLERYLHHRKQPVVFTRSRPYRKNDNAHVEGKNWTHIRQYLGYQRFDNPELVKLLNELYTSEWYYYFNFFIPSVKCITKVRLGSKIIKKYDPPKTPLQRILEAPTVSSKQKKSLHLQFDALDPFLLQKEMANKIKRILKIVNHEENAELLRNSDHFLPLKNGREIYV